MLKTILKNEFTITILAALLFIPFLGHVHLFDWDEINFAESAREMITTGNYFDVQINYARFSEKPPLFFWMQALSMKLFGINEFAARFPNALCGIVTLVLLFRIGRKIFDEQFARIWVMVYLGTLLTFFYFKSGIIDPWFNLFIFLAIYQFYRLTSWPASRNRHSLCTGVFLGLAVLTKGPVAVLIAALCYAVFVISKRFKFLITAKEFALIFLAALGVCFTWFGVDLLQNGPAFIIAFTQRQVAIFSTSDAGHGQPFFYHWWVLLLGCFPASVFFIGGQFSPVGNRHQKAFKQWMIILFWVTLLLFSIVKTKIVHYSSLCWFPLTFLAAVYLRQLWTTAAGRLYPVLKVLTAVIGGVLGLAIAALPLVMLQKDKWVHWVDDVFARGNLEAKVQWYFTDGIGGLLVLAAVIYFLVSKNMVVKTTLLFACVTVCCSVTMLIITPKIEAISQRANIKFFKSRQGEDCYVETWDYKSYAHYFYTMKPPFVNDSTKTVQWMLQGDIDKPAYISAKIQSRPVLDTMPELKFLYQENGFVFYKRLPVHFTQ
ncbi:MAG TPA: glycosyltransferase family 39 protein [Ferruginibacter sp.]|mgnify:CR=1 FL=1|nr:glycosyltransferase family 39 protein [Ferruginibacter sp.]HMP21584.1 glycosyltransferase family 39 protein [Ferruginibacter sp.]